MGILAVLIANKGCDTMSIFKKVKVLSVEQALALPYMTYRLALEGMQVLRVENPPWGDPNRSAGPRVLEEERMNAYFLPFNCGKKAVTLNLKTSQGRDIFQRLIKEWEVDIFACNQLPKRYKELGVDYETIRSLKKDIIWVGVTGYGPEVSERAYDPIIQARTGILGLTGEEDRTPFVCGVSLSDISASENGYGQIMKALYEREKTGNGSRIDISLFYSSLSYQAINITMNQNFGTPIERTGNNQRFFAPASVYPSSDGFVYLAIGNDRQYKVLTKVSGFKSLHHQKFETNEKRVQNKVELNCEIEKVTKNMASSMIEQLLSKAGIPIAKVQSIDEVIRSPLVSQRMLETIDPVTGLNMTLSPPPNSTDFMNMSGNNISFAPRLGEHNEEIFKNLLGYDEQSLKKFKDNRII